MPNRNVPSGILCLHLADHVTASSENWNGKKFPSIPIFILFDYHSPLVKSRKTGRITCFFSDSYLQLGGGRPPGQFLLLPGQSVNHPMTTASRGYKKRRVPFPGQIQDFF